MNCREFTGLGQGEQVVGDPVSDGQEGHTGEFAQHLIEDSRKHLCRCPADFGVRSNDLVELSLEKRSNVQSVCAWKASGNTRPAASPMPIASAGESSRP